MTREECFERCCVDADCNVAFMYLKQKKKKKKEKTEKTEELGGDSIASFRLGKQIDIPF